MGCLHSKEFDHQGISLNTSSALFQCTDVGQCPGKGVNRQTAQTTQSQRYVNGCKLPVIDLESLQTFAEEDSRACAVLLATPTESPERTQSHEVTVAGRHGAFKLEVQVLNNSLQDDDWGLFTPSGYARCVTLSMLSTGCCTTVY